MIYHSLLAALVIRFFCLLLLFFNAHVYACDIKVAAGNFTPYFKASTYQRHVGLYEQLLSVGLNRAGFSPTYINVSNDAIKRYYEKQRVDIAVNWTGTFTGKGYPSQYRLFFYNRAILSKNKKWIKAEHVLDLKGARLASFSGASLNFGHDFQILINDINTRYFESGDQLAVNKMLVANKIDVLIADWLKFYRFVKPLGLVDKFVPLDIITNAGSQIIFRDEKVRNAFDTAITQMYVSGELDKLTLTWLAKNNLPKVSHRFLAKRP